MLRFGSGREIVKAEPVSASGICSRLNFILLAFFLCVVAVAALLTYQRQRSYVRRESLSLSRVISSEIIEEMATNAYPEPEPEDGPVLHNDERLQRLVNRLTRPARFTIRVVSTLRGNPAFAPRPSEARELAALEKAKLPEYHLIVGEGGGSALLYLRSLIMEKRCLKCHGAYGDAPPAVRTLLPARSPVFGHVAGEFVGAVALRLPMSAIHSEVIADLRTDVLSRLILLGVLMLLLNLYIRKYFVGPIVSLCESCEAGEAVSLPKGKYPLEIRRLSGSLNVMIEALKRSESRSSPQGARGAVVGGGCAAVVAFREDGTVVAADTRAETLFGSGEGLVGRNLFALLEDAGPRLREIMPFCLMEGKPVGEPPFMRHRIVDPAGGVAEMEIGVAVAAGETPVYTAFLWEVACEPAPDRPEPPEQNFFFREKPEI
jgi:PAS domain-containing protein